MTYNRGDGIYRGIILATAGLMLIGTSPSKQGHAQPQSAQNASTLAGKSAAADVAAPEQPVAPSPDQGCEPGRDERKSDLCAQWKAADAASNAAEFARWQLWLSGLGVVGLLISLWLTRRSVKLASDTHQAFIDVERARIIPSISDFRTDNEGFRWVG